MSFCGNSLACTPGLGVGNYTISLTVTDSNNLTSAATGTIKFYSRFISYSAQDQDFADRRG